MDEELEKTNRERANKTLIAKCKNQECPMANIENVKKRYDHFGIEIKSEKDQILIACRGCGLELKDELVS